MGYKILIQKITIWGTMENRDAPYNKRKKCQKRKSTIDFDIPNISRELLIYHF